MTCQQVQVNLSLYLYGELEFAREEELEAHLAQCSFCQLALAREKSWHTSVNAEQSDVPLDLLSQCRRDLRVALQTGTAAASRPSGLRHWWFAFASRFGLAGSGHWRLSSIRWSPQLAFASLFLFLGFSLARWADHFPSLAGVPLGNVTQAGLASSFSRIRAIQGTDENKIRILVDQVQQREIIGSLDNASIRELLLQGSKDPLDPGLRVDSVELLNQHEGTDIRDALLEAVTRDENAAVRLKALEGLRRYQGDPRVRDTLLQVLQGDGSPVVRTEAIDVLVPANSNGPVNPALADTLRNILQSDPGDDYLHARCLQILRSNAHSGLY